MPENKIEWIYKCGTGWEYCKDGFCGRYNQLKEDGKHPAVEIAREWRETTGKEWKPEAIRTQFKKLTVTKSHDNEPCEADVKRKRRIDQEKMWLAVEKRLVETIKYIERNFEPPVKTSNGTKVEILGNLKLLKMYFD